MKDISKYTFIKRVKDAIRQYSMLERSDRVLAAVSGGPDSACLIRVLVDIRKQFGVEVVVGNLDHGLRRGESGRDSEFVKKVSRDLGLVCISGKAKKAFSKKEGISVEEWARRERYAFFAKAAGKQNCGVVATGHTMDDQAETVLLRILYGSSPSGLCGIPPVRYQGPLRIIRPLIRTERKDIIGFLKKTGTAFVEDSMNLERRFLRNGVRHEILPFLQKYNPRIKRTLTNLADALREDFSALEVEKEKAASGCSRKKGAVKLGVKVKDIVLQPRALRREIFKELFTRCGGSVKKLTYRHWMDMDYFLSAAAKGKSLNLPGSVRLAKTGDEIVFSKWR